MQERLKDKKSNLQKVLSNLVKSRRQNLHKSITLISDEINMTKSMWGDLERGIKDPQLSTIWRISEALEIPLSQLINELEKKLGNDFSLID